MSDKCTCPPEYPDQVCLGCPVHDPRTKATTRQNGTTIVYIEPPNITKLAKINNVTPKHSDSPADEDVNLTPVRVEDTTSLKAAYDRGYLSALEKELDWHITVNGMGWQDPKDEPYFKAIGETIDHLENRIAELKENNK